MDTIKSDTQRLLESLGAWEAFGATGWVEQQERQQQADNDDVDNDEDEQTMIFAGTVEHATGARERLKEYYTTPELEMLAEKLQAVDYEKALFNISKTRIYS
jgi:hypothetical protein